MTIEITERERWIIVSALAERAIKVKLYLESANEIGEHGLSKEAIEDLNHVQQLQKRLAEVAE